MDTAITINPMNLWVVLYHHRHGTSAQVVEMEHPAGPAAAAPEGSDTQAWLCTELFDEQFQPADDESVEWFRTDISTWPRSWRAQVPKQ